MSVFECVWERLLDGLKLANRRLERVIVDVGSPVELRTSADTGAGLVRPVTVLHFGHWGRKEAMAKGREVIEDDCRWQG